MSFNNEDKKMLVDHFTVNQLEAMNYMVGNSHTSESDKDYYVDEIATQVDSLSDLKIKMDEALGRVDIDYDVSVFSGGNDEVVNNEDLDKTKEGLQKINDSQPSRGFHPFFSDKSKEGSKSENIESLINSINKPVEKYIPPGQ